MARPTDCGVENGRTRELLWLTARGTAAARARASWAHRHRRGTRPHARRRGLSADGLVPGRSVRPRAARGRGHRGPAAQARAAQPAARAVRLRAVRPAGVRLDRVGGRPGSRLAGRESHPPVRARPRGGDTPPLEPDGGGDRGGRHRVRAGADRRGDPARRGDQRRSVGPLPRGPALGAGRLPERDGEPVADRTLARPVLRDTAVVAGLGTWHRAHRGDPAAGDGAAVAEPRRCDRLRGVSARVCPRHAAPLVDAAWARGRHRADRALLRHARGRPRRRAGCRPRSRARRRRPGDRPERRRRAGPGLRRGARRSEDQARGRAPEGTADRRQRRPGRACRSRVSRRS